MRWAGYVAHLEVRIAYNIMAGKPEAKRPLGTSWRRWENVIRIDLRKTGWEDMDWGLGRDQWRTFINTVMNLRVA
jgi:hypothetical protein